MDVGGKINDPCVQKEHHVSGSWMLSGFGLTD